MKMAKTSIKTEESKKSLIGIAVACTRVPGKSQILDGLIQSAQRGIEAGGGQALQLSFEQIQRNTAWSPALQYRLPRRDLLADEIEFSSLSAGLQGLVLLGDSQETLAGLLMGGVRSRRPAVLLTTNQESQSKNGSSPGLEKTLSEMFQKSGRDKKVRIAQMNLEQLILPEDARSTHALALVSEALGVSLPGMAALPAGSPERFELAYQSGERLMVMVQQNLSLAKILTLNAFTNAIRVDAAMGGSPDVLLHLMALAQECGVKLSLDTFDRVNRETPQMVGTLEDFHKAGGVGALLWALKNKLLPNPTVGGKNIIDLGKGGGVKDSKVIRIKNPYSKSSGLAVLFGNLAPAGAAMTGAASVPASRQTVTGPVKVFDSEENCFQAIRDRRLKKGEILVIRYEGPAGGPGMRPLHMVPALLEALGLIEIFPVITDGRFAGPPRKGILVGMVSPEAAAGGPISLLKDGDHIEIDIPNRQVLARLTNTELKVRMARWKPPETKKINGYLSRYSRLVTGAHQGAVVKC